MDLQILEGKMVTQTTYYIGLMKFMNTGTTSKISDRKNFKERKMKDLLQKIAFNTNEQTNEK